MATQRFRISINCFIGLIMVLLLFLGIWIFILLIFKQVSIFFLMFFIPLWYIIIILEREFLWTLRKLTKKAPYHHLSKTYGKHERILKNYLKSKKKKEVTKKKSLHLEKDSEIISYP